MSTVLVGTIGQSAWWSKDDGKSWERGKGALFLESDIRALLSVGGGRVLAGSEAGLYESSDEGRNWDALPDFPRGYQVWALATAERPEGGRRLWAGTCPAALFYSDDDGKRWTEAPARWLRTCAGGSIVVRITSFLIDGPQIWAGAEIDGVQYSADGGRTWERRDDGLSSLDIHGLAQMPGGTGMVAAATNNDVCLSEDGGLQWRPLQVGKQFRWSYCRSVAVSPDGALIVGNGSGPPGSGGAIWSSKDLGHSWEQESLPVEPNSTIWQIVVGSTGVWAFSVLGQVYRRSGEGAWKKLDWEFGEIRALITIG